MINNILLESVKFLSTGKFTTILLPEAMHCLIAEIFPRSHLIVSGFMALNYRDPSPLEW